LNKLFPVWILVAMLLGVSVGHSFPGIADLLDSLSMGVEQRPII